MTAERAQGAGIGSDSVGYAAQSVSADFVPLDRTFHALTLHTDGNDETDYRRTALGKAISWSELLPNHRTIILSEAGSGKTEEIRHAARTLRASGAAAFFLRLEHAREDFDVAFEEGTLAEFDQWLGSDTDGWLFLDSIDEARLREPLDFEVAIRRIGARISPALQRAHIVLSGRGTAWRPVTDLALCERHLPYHPPIEPQPPSTQKTIDADAKGPFKIVALDDLSGAQIAKFANARGINPAKPFLDAIERTDAWSLAARPDDLTELVAFWNTHGRIGDRLELMRASIKRRLLEREQNRAEALPLSELEALTGARQIAAAVTMAHTSLIRVPDGAKNAKGLSAAAILRDWDDAKLSALLSRPIFDEAIYGTVRFHHRTVREYLTAEWLSILLKRDASRRRIEAILFRKQYGIEVIAPLMRPVLVWLILLDNKVRARALAISPELVFEGGEPKALPMETRRAILADVCEGLLRGATSRSTSDYRAVQRFADDDLAADIKHLMAQHAAHDELQNFLVRMIWQGEIGAALPEAKAVAINASAGIYTRIAAIRAVEILGTASDGWDVRNAYFAEASALDRELLAELIAGLPRTKAGIDWLLACLARLKPKSRHSIDGLSDALTAYIHDLDVRFVPALVAELHTLLCQRPLVEARHCDISQHHGWLIKSAACAVERLVQVRDPSALSAAALSILQKLPAAQQYRHWDLKDIKSNLPALIAAWPELNDALFWFDIETSRRNAKKEERVIGWWQAGLFYRSYWQFEAADFDRVLSYVGRRELIDDRLVALSLAFRLYTDAKRPRAWRERMKVMAASPPALAEAMNEHLHPKARDAAARRWRRQEAEYKRKSALREAENAKREAESKEYLLNNIEALRTPRVRKPGQFTNAQYYPHEKMRRAAPRSGHWSTGNWRTLESLFGAEVALAFRDGVVSYWRGQNPRLLSEGKSRNKTPFSSIFGLTGLAIETAETEDWTSTLTADEAELACRYAMEELNGFPDWLPQLHAAFPESVERVLLSEIDYNLKIETTKAEHHYILSDLSWSGSWAWARLGPEIQKRLDAYAPKHLRNLEHMLVMLQGSDIDDAEIARLAERRSADRRLAHAARWFAVWAGVAPAEAIAALSARLQRTRKGKTTLAMHFVTSLLGGRRSGARTRSAFRTASYLKDLYRLMQEHIREKDDIERAGKGVYTPGLRDDAQDARQQLFSLLKEIPGKSAYLALIELGALHPEPSSRPWMLHHARAKAEADADLCPWSIEQTLDFQRAIERTPATHRELFELAELRLLDLKDELEQGDDSIADILRRGATQETQIRNYIGGWCRQRASGRYSVPQEEELADAKRPDLRFHGMGFDGPVPIELKLADKWTFNRLIERLDTQLCGDYLRDARSNRGLFVLVHTGEKSSWKRPGAQESVDFEGLIAELHAHWLRIASARPNVEDLSILGIDLTKRITS